jgi:hypothetical protein
MGSRAKSLLGSDKAVQVIPDAISAAEEAALVTELESVLKRRRYARDHWYAPLFFMHLCSLSRAQKECEHFRCLQAPLFFKP